MIKEEKERKKQFNKQKKLHKASVINKENSKQSKDAKQNNLGTKNKIVKKKPATTTRNLCTEETTKFGKNDIEGKDNRILTVKQENITVSNGLCFSCANKIYVIKRTYHIK